MPGLEVQGMNQVSLIGRLTRDPEIRSFGESDNRDVCELRIAVDNGRSRQGVERDPTYVDVATFDSAARACVEHLTKGRQVAVTGRLVYREWEAEDGSKRSKHSVMGRVEFLGSSPSSNGSAETESKSPPATVGAADEDIPF
jgi:single-strand DNA-binding protein